MARDRPTRAGTRGRGILRGSWRVARIVAVAWGLLVVAGCMLQERVIFPGQRLPAVRSAPPGVEVVWVEAEAGIRVEGWYLPAAGASAATPGPAVMVFHGNGELIDDGWFDVELYRPLGIGVLLCEYRGYGRSGGRPSQTGIVRDMRAFRDWLDARPEVDADRVLYHGRSLGGAVAAGLAGTRAPAGMVLTSTFTSMRDMFARHLVPGFLCRHPFETERSLTGFDGPVLLVHGDRDPLVPAAHSRRLATVAPRAELLVLEGEGHVMGLDRPDYVVAVRRFAGAVLGLAADDGQRDGAVPGDGPPITGDPPRGSAAGSGAADDGSTTARGPRTPGT